MAWGSMSASGPCAQEHHHKLTSVPLPTAGQAASTDGALELSHLPSSIQVICAH
jgi:hypothetical protein